VKRRGCNAVIAATQGGHENAARLLIERSADVNARDELVQLLSAAGAR
jgi:hypothetical protein